jgi:NAD(P)H dehydrogenase (quinone)
MSIFLAIVVINIVITVIKESNTFWEAFKMTILVTGATGQLGALVVERLLELVPAEQVAVSVRNPEKAAHLKAKGVDVRQGDYSSPEPLEKAFAGAERILIVSGTDAERLQQHKNAVDAAKKAGVSFIAYTSVANAPNSSLSLAADHKATEAYIQASGIPYAFLRNNWYIENEADGIKATAQGAPIVHASGAAKIGWAARRDYAHAAAAVLAGQGHENAVYELSGKLISHEELAAIVSSVLGKEVQAQNVDDAAYAKMLVGLGLPEGAAAFVTGFQTAMRDGALSVESNDLEKLLGRPQQPLAEVIAALLG